MQRPKTKNQIQGNKISPEIYDSLWHTLVQFCDVKENSSNRPFLAIMANNSELNEIVSLNKKLKKLVGFPALELRGKDSHPQGQEGYNGSLNMPIRDMTMTPPPAPQGALMYKKDPIQT